MLDEQLNGNVIEIESPKVNFLKNDFFSTREVDRNLKLFEIIESQEKVLNSNRDIECHWPTSEILPLNNDLPPNRSEPLDDDS